MKLIFVTFDVLNPNELKLTAYLPMIDELYRKYTGIDGSEATTPDTDELIHWQLAHFG